MPLLLMAGLVNGICGTPPGTQGNYFVLPGKHEQGAPFGSVRVTYGPVDGEAQWLELEIRAAANFDGPGMMNLRVLTKGDPLAGLSNRIEFERYVLKVAETGETLDYRICIPAGR